MRYALIRINNWDCINTLERCFTQDYKTDGIEKTFIARWKTKAWWGVNWKSNLNQQVSKKSWSKFQSKSLRSKYKVIINLKDIYKRKGTIPH